MLVYDKILGIISLRDASGSTSGSPETWEPCQYSTQEGFSSYLP